MDSISSKLSKAMEVVKSDDVDGHKLIWSFSSEHMKPDDVPPISALVYGTRRILFPEMHWESTPDLLDIFALAETVRQQTLQDAREGLEWDQYYRKGGKMAADGVALTDQERRTLQLIVKKADSENIRKIYRTVIMQLCWAHIHLIRRSRETYRILPFFRRYFPPSRELKLREASSQLPLWLSGLSESELVEYDTTRKRVKDFLQDVEQWEQEYLRDVPDNDAAYKEARMTPEYQTHFCERFSLLVEWNKLADITLRHVKKVQHMASNLRSVFSEGDPSDIDVTDSGVFPILGRSQYRHGEVTVFSSSHADPRQVDRVEIAERPNQDAEGKESQESNVSSKLSYVDVPSNIGRAPPTSLLVNQGL